MGGVTDLGKRPGLVSSSQWRALKHWKCRMRLSIFII